jgi:hypothetical protein
MAMAASVFLGFCKSDPAAINIGVWSHAEIKHKDEALLARNCLDKNGPNIIYNKSDTRKVRLCLMPDKSGLAIQVLDLIDKKWEEITAYVNPSVDDLNGALGYAEEDMGKYGWIAWQK